jgi:Reverse transcriptase (RNA-dependent DNA polymerase)
MQDEIEGQTANGNWIIMAKEDIPIGTKILPSVWAMRSKRTVLDSTIYKWKACLNIDGGKQTHGVDYWDTYAPVTSWSTIRLILLVSIINQWEIC